MLTRLCSFRLDLVLYCKPELESMLLCCLHQIQMIEAGVVAGVDVGLQHKLPNKLLLKSKHNRNKKKNKQRERERKETNKLEMVVITNKSGK